MFARLIRLNVPYVQLDMQGRARAEIAALYSWRYQANGQRYDNLPAIYTNPEYIMANAGFAHAYQFVDVPYFQKRGEFSPKPFSYQNLGEAEYVVAVFQFMCLLGYPAEKISILTTYNGQKQLIKEIYRRRCQNSGNNRLFGRPRHITTVDKFQGQQNDYILLSLVRTEAIGHIRDVRRLVVALSRARLGLYIFGHLANYEKCHELVPILSRLTLHPTKLQLLAGDRFPCSRPVASSEAEDPIVKERMLEVADVTAMGILVYQMAQQAEAQIQSTGASNQS